MKNHPSLLLITCIVLLQGESLLAAELAPYERGPYATATTNLVVAPEYSTVGDRVMFDYLLGRTEGRFLPDILQYPDAAQIVEVDVPDVPALYGPASGKQIPVVSFVTFPARPPSAPNPYRFPYDGGPSNLFEHMLMPGEAPRFAEDDARYPMILLSHGWTSHGLYEIPRAELLASHGYIVVSITYGDEQVRDAFIGQTHIQQLRPLYTQAVLDSLIDDPDFGPHIDTDNIGISGHSFGGTTALALAGGDINGQAESVKDGRFAAISIAAPWVGGLSGDGETFVFGEGNASLAAIQVPAITFFGSVDDATPAATILPATRKLSGPRYVVELVDQPHVFAPRSWRDRDTWEMTFFNAYLRQDAQALADLGAATRSLEGEENRQLFDYQRRDSAETSRGLTNR